MNLYPVNLNIKDKTCLIVGGGEVAGRKARELLSCDARVVIISPRANPEMQKLARQGSLEWRKKKYSPGDLEGAYLVFAATDNRAVQRSIIVEAEKRKILVNNADDPVECTFHVPAKVRRGNFLLTISTGGGSPALAAKLRKDLEAEYGLEYQQLVDLFARIREKVVVDGAPPQAHKILFKKLLQLNILNRIRKEDWTLLQKELGAILPKEMDVNDLIDSIQSADKSKSD